MKKSKKSQAEAAKQAVADTVAEQQPAPDESLTKFFEPSIYDSKIPLRRGQRFSKKAVLAALKASQGLVAAAARRMNCTTGTVRNYLKRYPELQDELTEIRDSYVDLAEASLLKQIQEKNTTATIFLLKCLGKRRGWIESPNVQVHAHVDGSGNWADIMKRVAIAQGDGSIKATPEELARILGPHHPLVVAKSANVCGNVKVIEAEVEDVTPTVEEEPNE